MKKFTILGLIITLLISCSVFTKKQNGSSKPQAKTIIIDNGHTKQKNNIEVISLKIDQNILYINVKSETACNHDDFNLYTNDIILKSMPPKKVLSLEHIKTNNSCNEKLNKQLAFNIEELTQTTYKELILLLNNKSISLIK